MQDNVNALMESYKNMLENLIIKLTAIHEEDKQKQILQDKQEKMRLLDSDIAMRRRRRKEKETRGAHRSEIRMNTLKVGSMWCFGLLAAALVIIKISK